MHRGISHRYRDRHRPGGSGEGLRGVPSGGDCGQEGGRHGPWVDLVPQVCGTPWREDLGEEPARGRLDVHVHDPRTSRRLAAALLGESRGAALTFVFCPALLSLAPVPLMSLFMPLAAVVLLPTRWYITTILSPSRRRDSVVADRNLKDRGRNVQRCHHRPWSVPSRADVPAAALKCPILMAVEEYDRRSARRVVDGHARNHHERWRRR